MGKRAKKRVHFLYDDFTLLFSCLYHSGLILFNTTRILSVTVDVCQVNVSAYSDRDCSGFINNLSTLPPTCAVVYLYGLAFSISLRNKSKRILTKKGDNHQTQMFTLTLENIVQPFKHEFTTPVSLLVRGNSVAGLI